MFALSVIHPLHCCSSRSTLPVPWVSSTRASVTSDNSEKNEFNLKKFVSKRDENYNMR